jgi:hypothetical protein
MRELKETLEKLKNEFEEGPCKALAAYLYPGASSPIEVSLMSGS